MLIEVCCGSVDDALCAEAGGADRIELNSAMFLGGLTASIGELELATEKLQVPIIAMIRPRGGGFCYTENEFDCMKRDTGAFIRAGVAGIVFGILREDGSIDEKRNAILANMAAGIEVVFHRAIDVVPSWQDALDHLVDIGFRRVLTTGQKPDIEDGAHTVKQMVEYANGRIEILPGGLKPHNILALSAYMNTEQAHIASFQQVSDNSCQHNRAIFFGGALYPPEQSYEVLDPHFVSRSCQKGKEG